MRRLFSLLVIVSVLFAACGQTNVGNTASDSTWYGAGRNTFRTGRASGEVLPPFGALWAVDAPGVGVSSASVAKTPVGSELRDKGTEEVAFFSSGDKSVFAVSKDSGKVLWSITYRAEASDPAYSDGRVVFVTNDGIIQCNDAWTGNELWVSRYSTLNTITREESAPVISGGFVVGGFSTGLVKAFDLETGHEVWREKLEDRINSCPVVVEGKVIFASYSKEITAFNIATGSKVWTAKLSGPVIANLVSDGDSVFACGAFGDVQAFDVADGRELWQVDTRDTMTHSPCVIDEKVIIPLDTGKILVLKGSDGSLINELNAPKPSSGLVSAGNLLLFTTQEGKLVSVDLLTGESNLAYEFATWQEGVTNQRFGDIAIVDGRVYVSDGQSKFFCLVPKDIAQKAHAVRVQPDESENIDSEQTEETKDINSEEVEQAEAYEETTPETEE